MAHVAWRRVKTTILTLFVLLILLPHATLAATNKPLRKIRLGTAASPFGWATAIGKLDSDEKLDFAVADRIGLGAQGYDYSLELGLSLEQSQTFHFHSPHSTLTVSLLDLDNDRDLDVVVTHAVSGEVAGVWINNGSGQFHQGNAADFNGVEINSRSHAGLTPKNLLPAVPGLPLRRLGVLAVRSFQFCDLPGPEGSRATRSETSVPPCFSHPVNASRAPPQSVLS